MIQRYLAMKTDADARLGLFLGTSLSIPVWFYFAFVGTALYVFYKLNPTDIIEIIQKAIFADIQTFS